MNIKKSLITILIFTLVLISVTNVSYSATLFGESKVNPEGDIFALGKAWLKTGKDNSKDIKPDQWTNFNDVVGLVWGIAVFVAAIGGTILGIKYMFSSLEEKANIKRNMMPYIIGTIIILGALSIWKFAIDFLDGIST